MSAQTCNQDIKIPKASFTAFRLSYASSYEVSQLSKCELIGGVPDVWWETKSQGIISGTTKLAKNKVKKKYKQAMDTVNDSILSGSSVSTADTFNSNDQDDEFKLFLKGEKNIDIARVVQQLRQESLDDGNSELKVPTVSAELDQKLEELCIENPKAYNHESIKIESNNTGSFLNPIETFDCSTATNSLNRQKCLNMRNRSYSSTNLLRPPSNNTREKYSMSIPSTNSIHSSLKENISLRKTTKSTSRGNFLICQNPEPEVQYTAEKISKERERYEIRNKVMMYARAAKGRTKRRTNNLRLRIGNVILRQYKDGEVFRIDKMLVLIKQIRNKQELSKLTEYENFDARIYERWKEYLVILRKNDDVNKPVLIQFKDLESSPKSSPEFYLYVNEHMTAQFYSDFDKSICITMPKDNSFFMYILRAKDQVTSFRWLYFIRQILGYEGKKLFQVHIPDISIDFKINISPIKLMNMLEQGNHMKIKILDKGYNIEYSKLIQFLKEHIQSELRDINNPLINEWIYNNASKWFCFKNYDRLEWVPNNSHSFYIQYQLLSDKFQLDLRCKNSLIEKIKYNDKIIDEPAPIEGFLSRLSDNLGKEKKIIRNFYKFSYFYSNDNILFYMKYYRAIPPSPDNILMNNDLTTEGEIKFPTVYVRSPFPLDENGHITWLNPNLEEFEKHDHSALCEFERRAQQVIKAEGMIDMRQIKHVKAISPENITKTQKLAHCLFWYSNTHLIDDLSVVDSGFVIELNNGSILKLQAPNQITRDKWIEKLLYLKMYWVKKIEANTRRIIDVREKNIQNLKINEYIDSNIFAESSLLEIKKSTADPYIHNINCLAMSRSILCNGYLYQKSKKHSSFNQYYVVLCPGFLMLFSVYKRSKSTGVTKNNTSFSHYLTIPLSNCYIYSGNLTSFDLLDNKQNIDPSQPGQNCIPRIYSDGWKSSEEESVRCFTLWFGKKKQISHQKEIILNYNLKLDEAKNSRPKNPNSIKLAARLGITGKSIVFMTRSRQEREIWVQSIFTESNRLV